MPSGFVAPPTPIPSSQATPRALYPVESVTDGDTIRVTVDGVSEPIRIIGLDSPELRKPGTPVECMAREATAAAKRLIASDWEVALEEDPTQDTRDRYGRLLAHVFLSDGRLFSEEMIRGGLPVHYVYDGVPSIYADRLAAAEDEAITAERGLWSSDSCAGNLHAPSAPA